MRRQQSSESQLLLAPPKSGPPSSGLVGWLVGACCACALLALFGHSLWWQSIGLREAREEQERLQFVLEKEAPKVGAEGARLFRSEAEFGGAQLEQAGREFDRAPSTGGHRQASSFQGVRRNVIKCGGAKRRSGKRRRLIVVVNSAPGNRKRRALLRSDWLKRASLRAKLCQRNQSAGRGFGELEFWFALGTGGCGPAELEAIREEEAESGGDLLLLDQLQDNYRNLTTKHLAIFNWLLEQNERHLDQVALLKSDDDARLALDQWLDELELGATDSPGRSGGELLCARFPAHSPVCRRRACKWRLSRAEWPYDTFPEYCSGLAYAASSLRVVRNLWLANRLLERAKGKDNKLLWIDDVHVTGLLRASLQAGSVRPQLVALNGRFCYSRAQWLARAQLGQACLAAEVALEE